MGRVITDLEGTEAFESWLRNFLPQLFDQDFVLEPGELGVKLSLDLVKRIGLLIKGKLIKIMFN